MSAFNWLLLLLCCTPEKIVLLKSQNVNRRREEKEKTKMETETVLAEVLEETNGNETKEVEVDATQSKEEMTNGSNGNHDKGWCQLEMNGRVVP